MIRTKPNKREKESTTAKLKRTNYPTKAHTRSTYRFIEHHILKYKWNIKCKISFGYKTLDKKTKRN
jgi:hypothetical protein